MGAFSLDAQAAPAPGGSVIRNIATATYLPDGYAQSETATSNDVIANVQSVEALVLTQDQSVMRPPSVSVSLSHLLTNTGNVPSSYTIGLANNGTGCSADTLDLNNLRIVRDLNNNGVVDPNDPVIAIGTAGAIALKPGETASLIVQGTTPGASSGSACFTLSALTALQALTALNHDTVTLGSVAVMSLTKSASYPGFVIPGTTTINFVVSGTNIGAQDAAPVSTVAPGSVPILVNGAPATLFLLRDLIPAGTRYLAGSLQSTAAGAVRLFRLSGDPDFSYRTAEDASAIEVAIGIPTAISRNASVAMQFAVKVNANQTGEIRNTAQNYYFDATTPTLVNSNTLVITSTPTRIGVAKAANTPRVNLNPAGGSDGTATVTFTARLKNYGSTWLYDVQATDQLEGAGASQFGTYTAAAVPGAGQYTLVSGSLAIVGNQGNAVAGTVAAVNPLFNGATVRDLLASGAVLPAGGETSVKFDVRVNLAGRTQTMLNTVRAQAALTAGSPPAVFDDSVNGADPDPDGDGNPNNNTAPTPVSAQLPALTLVKTASFARRVEAGVYELDYTLQLTNNGSATAPNVRLVDNLNCTFDMDLPTGKIAAWELVGRPRMAKGALLPASGFTGRAICDRAGLASNDAFRVPTEVALSLTDGSRALAAGQSETISFTVRVTEKPGTIGTRVVVTNKAWAASYEANTVNVTPALLVAATSNSVQSLLIDPQGTVYNAISRQPIPGAVVTYKRQSCSSGGVTPITADEVFGSGSGVYTLNADGSISMTTGADGSYQFFLKSPLVASLCTYSVQVKPPVGSAYVFPSELIPVTPGTYTGCSAVTSSATAPRGSDSTTHYFSVQSGVSPGPGLGVPCETIHNHIPLDPGNIFGLVLKKEGSKATAELGDFIDYALTLTNKTGFPVTGLTFNDVLPAGFAYVAGSARFNGVATPNPAGGAGPSLVFNYPAIVLGVDESATVRYRLRIGVGAPIAGDAVNRARANSSVLQSNQASWRVRVNGGVFSDEAYIFGKVHMDCRRDGSNSGNGIQGGTDEIGIPGVRIYMEDGTNVVTDVEGKWSLYGIKPITHVLRVDQTTLPAGARLEVLDNRNANNPASRFVDLKKGEFHKANFIVGNCDNPSVKADVATRRKLISERPDADGEAAVRVRLDPQGRQIAVGDTRSLPATGQSSLTGIAGSTVPSSQALIKLPTAPVDGSSFIGGAGNAGTLGNAQQGGALAPRSADTSSLLPGGVGSSVGTAASSMSGYSGLLLPAATSLLPQPAPSSIELEQLMPTLDNKPGFINLEDRDTVASQAINIQVKGPAGTQLRLFVNSQPIDGKRVGKKAALASKNLAAWEYIGVQLKPGSNLLRLDVMDDFGVVRGTEQIGIIAPDKLGAIQIDVPATAQADQRTPIVVKVRLTDANGVPVTARTQVTLESDRGRWLEDDLNKDEPGLQGFIEGGAADFHLLPPGEPGDARIRASSASLVQEVRLALLPEMRPMIGIGIVEGAIDFTKRGKLSVGQTPAGAAFETELSSIGGNDNGNASSRTAARSAFFFKGTVKGEYLLTAAYDSDKATKDRLFRDIRPDEFYPIYGESSFRGFDAQSTQKLYVRIDKNRSYLLYGDFTTASSTEVRQLSQTSRTLTGIKSVVETDTVRATSYAASTAQTQQVEEFPARGISGPYFLSMANGDLLSNSERIEILVRDRNQPNIVLQTTAATRFLDYTIEPLTQRLLFTRPIASLDTNLNPQSIRVTYEVNGNGPKFTVAGTDVQVKVNDNLQLGVVASTDQNPDNKRKLGALTAVARMGDNTTVAAELVRTDSDLKGTGNAGRIELRHQDGPLEAMAQLAKTDTGFDNPGATFTAGRTEAIAKAQYKVDSTTSVRGEAIYGKDALTEGSRKGVAIGVQKKLSETMVGELGLRHGTNSSATASAFDYNQVSSTSGALGAINSGNAGNSVTTLGAAAVAGGTASEQDLTTVRARLTTAVPNLPQAQVFIEGEQDINHSDRHVLAAGGNYAITDKTRAYGRYEFISSLDGPYGLSSSAQRNVGMLGIESNYMEGGRVYNEYRLADSLDGRTGQAAMGVRNTFKVNEQWRLTAGIERTSATGSSNSGIVGQGNSTAIVSGAEYLTENVKASGIFEARYGDDAKSYLSNIGLAYKIDTDWSLLARSTISDSQGQGTNAGNNRQLSRQQIGVALRPVDQDVWNALARYEHKSERVSGSGQAAGAISGNSFGNDANLPGTYAADIVSAHFNYNPERGSYLMGRYAAKISSADDGFLKSTYWANLAQLRYTRDLNKDWDIGVQGALLYGKGGALQKSLGLEAGYLVAKDLWVSAGYNFVGLHDRDLTAGQYTSKGAFLRLRYKFDETNIGYAQAGSAMPATVYKPEPVPAPLPEPVPAPAPLPEPAPAPAVVKTSLRADALFDFDSAQLKPGATAVLADVVSRIKATQDPVVLTVGHTDSVGSDVYNQKLSAQRAQAVKAYLVSQGIAADRISAEGRGERQPVASNANFQGRALNRRVEIEVAAGAK